MYGARFRSGYGVLLQNLQSRNGIIEKIRGCVIDSAPCAEMSPQVWAAGYCAALLKKRSPSLVEPVEGQKLDARSNRMNAQDIIPAFIEITVLKVLEIFFSLAFMLPYANQRLSSIISTLKDQPPCPQLYLYSTADKMVISSRIQKASSLTKQKQKQLHAECYHGTLQVQKKELYSHQPAGIIASRAANMKLCSILLRTFNGYYWGFI
ncbi:uncharacterized protein A4U43_C06F6370 [Asparagus officinalis]|uniref:Uncharacterized protein n=1 Tax=Asparagus officinalis TaxID=4686 RepID=A0A5P1EQK5_ASPOF|nr:uncharacterized protein A4U43_C06F6370 [Asparagus officinalis]